MNHRFIREARGTQNLVHLIKRYEGWVALGEEEEYEDQPQEHEEYPPPDPLTLTHNSPNESWDETWDFGTIRPSYGHNTGIRRYATRSASGTMRAVNSPAAQGGREPLQPLPTMQRPMTPPQTQRQSPKYGGMAKTDSKMSSPNKKDGHLQIATREEIDMFDSMASDEDGMGYYDIGDEDDDDDSEVDGRAGTSTTVKMYEKPSRAQDQSQISATAAAGWQVNDTPPQPPPKSSIYSRSDTQVATTPAQSRYAKSDGATGIQRTSATSSTAMSPPGSSVPAFSGNIPRSRHQEQTPKPPQRRYDALEDILLPALDEVPPTLSPPSLFKPSLYRIF